MASVLCHPRFHGEEAAYAWVEERLWPDGPACPRCKERGRVGKLAGKSTRFGVHKCYRCRKPSRVTVGTVFEASHIPLHTWLQAITLLSSSKKGIGSNQLHRTLGIGRKAAWFLSRRVREAMRSGDLAPTGGPGGIVEADETCFGKAANRRPRNPKLPPPTEGGHLGPGGKRAIVSLVERGGSVRSSHVEDADKATVNVIASGNVARENRLRTDESRVHGDALDHVAEHETVRPTRPASTSAATSTPTRRKATSRSPSGAWGASTSTAARSTCTATSPSPIPATTTARRWATATRSAPPPW